MKAGAEAMLARRAGIDTLDMPLAYMRRDCTVCRAEGFNALTRIRLGAGEREVIATLNVVDPKAAWLAPGEVGLSDAAWNSLGVQSGEPIAVNHAPERPSLAHVRARLYGKPIADAGFREIVSDIVAGRYSDIEIATFLAACSARPLNHDEMVGLTGAMVAAGERLQWPRKPVFDKHCIGGLPGNRTTPIVVAIAAAAGLCIPKTSSRAITSPAGTADTVETLMPVNLGLEAMRGVVEREGGCLVWGGSVNLSPADDRLIRIERAIEVDSVGQLVASVLSKKVAAGSSSVLIDIPVGPTAKVRTGRAAGELAQSLLTVGEALALEVRCHFSDGSQPVGRGLGPAHEARDVLAVLQGEEKPPDLRARALDLAAFLLEMAGIAEPSQSLSAATAILDDGRAWAKFESIAEAQGGLRKPPEAPFEHTIVASHGGLVTSVDNRRLARLAKLAGAPDAPAAGLRLQTRLGDRVAAGQPLMTLTAEASGELDYAARYARAHPDIWEIQS